MFTSTKILTVTLMLCVVVAAPRSSSAQRRANEPALIFPQFVNPVDNFYPTTGISSFNLMQTNRQTAQQQQQMEFHHRMMLLQQHRLEQQQRQKSKKDGKDDKPKIIVKDINNSGKKSARSSNAKSKSSSDARIQRSLRQLDRRSP